MIERSLDKLGLKKGFTLAEVLITLGIIGVVAAITIPTLISNYNKKVAETRLVKFYSVMNQAIKLSEVENGPKEQWQVLEKGYAEDEDGNVDSSKPYAKEWFNKYLKPYLKTLKVDETTQNITGYVLVYFPDGSLAMFSAASIVFYPVSNDYAEKEHAIDPGVIKNNPEFCGTKYFDFFFNPWLNNKWNKHHYQKGMEPYLYAWDDTNDMLLNDPAIGCKQNVTNERAYCTKLIQMNGWKIPDDYPLKF